MKNSDIVCKHCGSANFIKKGGSDNARTFLCKSCNKRFNYTRDELRGTKYDMDVTPINRLHPVKATTSSNGVSKRVGPIRIMSSLPTLDDLFINNKKPDKKVVINNVDITNAKKDSTGKYYIKYGIGIAPSTIHINDLRNMIKSNPAASLSIDDNNIIMLNLHPAVKG